MSIPLAVLEGITDASGVARAIEALLPAGARHRQLKVRTLFLGMMLALADDRPAHLTRVHQALTALPGPDQARLGVMQDWSSGQHQLTYRQVERTFSLVAAALARQHPDGAPSDALARICDGLLEASIPPGYPPLTSALAVDWTDVESFARPPRHGTTGCADPEASRGHRNSNLMGTWQVTADPHSGLKPSAQAAGACLPDPCPNSNRHAMSTGRSAGSGRCGGGGRNGDPYSRRWTRSVRGEPGARDRSPPSWPLLSATRRRVAAGLAPGAGMGGRGRCHPQDRTPHSDASPQLRPGPGPCGQLGSRTADRMAVPQSPSIRERA